jgi:hypothetical protein
MKKLFTISLAGDRSGQLLQGRVFQSQGPTLVRFFLLSLLLVPLSAFAAVPAFPMAFYGGATINGTVAPVGTIIKSYYGTTLAGQVTITETGTYGYNNPTKQQLLVSEGTGTIKFTVITPSINSAVETEGDAPQTHSAFASGESMSKTLAFTWTAPTPPPPPPSPPTPAPSPSPSGGGGGGNSVSVLYGCVDPRATNYSPIANRDNGACLYALATTTIAAATRTPPVIVPPPARPQGAVLGASTVNKTNVYKCMRSLNIGSSGIDVTELQKRLTADGFYAGPISGYFGPMTAAAVKKFQAKNNLEAVGNVGPKTCAHFNQNSGAVLGASTSSPGAGMTTEARAALIKQLLTLILELQKQLEALKAAQI